GVRRVVTIAAGGCSTNAGARGCCAPLSVPAGSLGFGTLSEPQDGAEAADFVVEERFVVVDDVVAVAEDVEGDGSEEVGPGHEPADDEVVGQARGQSVEQWLHGSV